MGGGRYRRRKTGGNRADVRVDVAKTASAACSGGVHGPQGFACLAACG
jgi:hypothetical protein